MSDERSADEPESDEGGGSGRRVLVVCRTAGAMIQLLAAFTAAGHLATGRYTDEEALAALLERPFDVVVVDDTVEAAARERLAGALRQRGLAAVRLVARAVGQDVEALLLEV